MLKKDRRNTVIFKVRGNDQEDTHTIYWRGSDEIVLHSHREQTFAQFMATWTLMGQPAEGCGCAQFVRAFREMLVTRNRYGRQFEIIRAAAAGNIHNYQLFSGRVEAMLEQASARAAANSSEQGCDPLTSSTRSGRIESVLFQKKRKRFMHTMRPAFWAWEQGVHYDTGLYDIEWAQGGDADGLIYTDLHVSGTKSKYPRLGMKVNLLAWDALHRGYAHVYDPDNNLIMGVELKRLPKKKIPALCFKVLMITSDPGVQRFRIGYRYMSLAIQADGTSVEEWHPAHAVYSHNDWDKHRF